MPRQTLHTRCSSKAHPSGATTRTASRAAAPWQRRGGRHPPVAAPPGDARAGRTTSASRAQSPAPPLSSSRRSGTARSRPLRQGDAPVCTASGGNMSNGSIGGGSISGGSKNGSICGESSSSNSSSCGGGKTGAGRRPRRSSCHRVQLEMHGTGVGCTPSGQPGSPAGEVQLSCHQVCHSTSLPPNTS